MIVGSGIFVSPNEVFQQAGSIAAGLLSWVIASFLACLSALVYAELGTLLPTAGGDYDYLTAAFGPSVGFAYLFSTVIVNKPASQAIMGITFAQYIGRVALGRGSVLEALNTLDVCPAGADHNISTPVRDYHEARGRDIDGHIPNTFLVAVAISCVVAVTLLCSASVHFGRRVMSVLTFAKFLVITFLVSSAAVFAFRHHSDGDPVVENLLPSPSGHLLDGGFSVVGLVNAVAAGLFAFDGWACVSNLPEDLRDPSSIPTIVVSAMAAVLGVYILLNIAYLAAVPNAFFALHNSTSAQSPPVATDVSPHPVRKGVTPVGVTSLAGSFAETQMSSLSPPPATVVLTQTLSMFAPTANSQSGFIHSALTSPAHHPSSSIGHPHLVHHPSHPSLPFFPTGPNGGTPRSESVPIALAAAAAATSCSVWAVGTVACLVGIGILATLQSSLMTGARMIFAAARAGEAPAFLAAVTPWKTPVGSLLLMASLAIGLLLSPLGQRLSDLMAFFAVASWIFYGLIGVALLVLKSRAKSAAAISMSSDMQSQVHIAPKPAVPGSLYGAVDARTLPSPAEVDLAAQPLGWGVVRPSLPADRSLVLPHPSSSPVLRSVSGSADWLRPKHVSNVDAATFHQHLIARGSKWQKPSWRTSDERSSLPQHLPLSHSSCPAITPPRPSLRAPHMMSSGPTGSNGLDLGAGWADARFRGSVSRSFGSLASGYAVIPAVRQWHSPMYPLAPVLLVLMSLFLMATLIIASPFPSLVSLFLVVVAIPLRVCVNHLLRVVPLGWKCALCCFPRFSTAEFSFGRSSQPVPLAASVEGITCPSPVLRSQSLALLPRGECSVVVDLT
eukprot:TRINITY_DN1517_c0_g2_i1.p1 TRINITY_DN1517_c0_g2~~TRINITY_DN1517_c0_g2_i1.p1  ORF type:complete len:895 (+),score=16.87 TRINITY_DN1517_c0_g2_i1:165-2687(+)